jgi:hypothetical protein
MPEYTHVQRIERLLRRPLPAAAMLAELDVSQPTFSRWWRQVGDGVVLGAGRSSQYALRRPVPGVIAPIAVFRVGADGQVEAMGTLAPLQGGYYVLNSQAGSAFTLYEGMPFFMSDLRPQGFLARLEPGRHRDLDLPADIQRWTGDQVVKYMALYSLAMEDADCRPEQGFRGMNALLVNSPAPSQIVGEVTGGNTVEAAEPCVEAAVIGIHVLHMNGTLCMLGHAIAATQVDERMGDAGVLRKSTIRRVRVGHQQGISGKYRR